MRENESRMKDLIDQVEQGLSAIVEETEMSVLPRVQGAMALLERSVHLGDDVNAAHRLTGQVARDMSQLLDQLKRMHSLVEYEIAYQRQEEAGRESGLDSRDRR